MKKFSISRPFRRLLSFSILIWLSLALLFMAPLTSGWKYIFICFLAYSVLLNYFGKLRAEFGVARAFILLLLLDIPLSKEPLRYCLFLGAAGLITYLLLRFERTWMSRNWLGLAGSMISRWTKSLIGKSSTDTQDIPPCRIRRGCFQLPVTFRAGEGEISPDPAKQVSQK